MSVTTLVTFLKVLDSNGNVQDLYQNAKRDSFGALDNGSGVYVQSPNNYITFNGENYYYLPFLYQGAAKNRSGDNLEAQLVLANNTLAMNRAREAVTNKWHIEVSVCIVNTSTLSPERTLTTDNWLASSLSYDPTTVEVLLSSAIDAVGSNAPSRVLTTAMVGALPTSGQMQNR